VNASLVEILWTAAALPGLALWAWNYLSARATLRSVKAVKSGTSFGALLWARFSVQLTAVFVGVELAFVVLGVISMTRPNNPQATTLTSYVIAGVLILASAGISYLAYRWRAVDQQLVGAARTRRTTQDQDSQP
jgi:hypothetical protein